VVTYISLREDRVELALHIIITCLAYLRRMCKSTYILRRLSSPSANLYAFSKGRPVPIDVLLVPASTYFPFHHACSSPRTLRAVTLSLLSRWSSVLAAAASAFRVANSASFSLLDLHHHLLATKLPRCDEMTTRCNERGE
jgi:hypothetical protein